MTGGAAKPWRKSATFSVGSAMPLAATTSVSGARGEAGGTGVVLIASVSPPGATVLATD